MKKTVLVMLVILMHVCFISCESDDDLYYDDEPIEIGTDDGNEEILPPPTRPNG